MIRLTRLSSAGGGSPVRLEGESIFLRQIQAEDWAEWAELRAESRHFLAPWEPTWQPDALAESTYLRRVRRLNAEWKMDEGYAFHVFERQGGRLVGGIGLSQVRRGVAQTGTLGYWAGQPFAGKGFITEGATLIGRFAFRTAQLHRIEAACLPENIASRRVLEKAGFVREGYARSYLKIAGQWRDHLTFALLSEDQGPSGSPP